MAQRRRCLGAVRLGGCTLRTRVAAFVAIPTARVKADRPAQLRGNLVTANPVPREWCGVTRAAPSETLPQLFQAQVTRTPDATAVTCRGKRLSYAELNTRANQLARRLVGLGAGPERLVAIAMPRSAEMLVAVLAVLKAGAAYVPLDPGYPAERIGFVLADARPVAVLTTAVTGRNLPGEVPQVVIDDPVTVAAISRLPDGDLADADRVGALRPASPAYVIYTSGSTGQPKGVLVEHRNAAGLLRWA